MRRSSGKGAWCAHWNAALERTCHECLFTHAGDHPSASTDRHAQCVYLPPNLGYAVEAGLAPTAFHVDGVSTLRIKIPGFCERAT